ncbi:hypothetical protein Hanom_Chr07g00636191 [Helianthus anomalus]
MLTKPVFKFVTLLRPWSSASCVGCVLRAKPNRKWTRGHEMRSSSTGCVLQASDASLEHGMSGASF